MTAKDRQEVALEISGSALDFKGHMLLVWASKQILNGLRAAIHEKRPVEELCVCENNRLETQRIQAQSTSVEQPKRVAADVISMAPLHHGVIELREKPIAMLGHLRFLLIRWWRLAATGPPHIRRRPSCLSDGS
ncbi:MAG: hypothetical protein HZB38_09855 [Planctomycetes bacterium]|nr:hypothetical protein [Planctomycetota bacterium]